MITKQFFNLDINATDINLELEEILQSNYYAFILKWTTGKKIILLDCIAKKGSKEFDLIKQPVLDSDGTITIELGQHKTPDFKLYFRVYAVESVPKMKAFLIDKTNGKSIKSSPAGKKTKALKKKELWPTSI